MCGIVGICNTAGNNVVPDVIEALNIMEYRGYDSVGLSGFINDRIVTSKSVSSIDDLKHKAQDMYSSIAIGHNRWATHGAVNETNCHPHSTEHVSLVHNGIIENYQEIKQDLISKGIDCCTKTDTEVVLKLLNYLLQIYDIDTALNLMLNRLLGNFAIVIILKQKQDAIFFLRKSFSPLLISRFDDGFILASDSMVIRKYSSQMICIQDDYYGHIDSNRLIIKNCKGKELPYKFEPIVTERYNPNKTGYDSFLIKEISEQPNVIAKTIRFLNKHLKWSTVTKLFEQCQYINIVACGSSYHSAMVAKYWFEEFTDYRVNIDVSSEFRYRKIRKGENIISIFISQSGETADTLLALLYAKEAKHTVIGVTNVIGSSIARSAHFVIPTRSGVEISVASTKVFTAQLITMFLFVLKLHADQSLYDHYVKILQDTPNNVRSIIKNMEHYLDKVIESFHNIKSFIFTGRNILYPIALEGALKFKELSYLQATGIATGELKHGTLALVDNSTLTIVLANNNHLLDKIYSNIQEVSSRNGNLIVICDERDYAKFLNITQNIILLPSVDPMLQPLYNIIPLQMIAYRFALSQDLNVDKPRNLAKSVTVE